jgi:hypothetical protein
MTKDILSIALANQSKLAKAIKGQELPNNHPFDVIKTGFGIEVKTIIRGGNDKITTHPDSRIRKEQEMRKTKVRGFTVAFDERSGKTEYYYKQGFGAFRLTGMTKAKSLRDLSRIFA